MQRDSQFNLKPWAPRAAFLCVGVLMASLAGANPLQALHQSVLASAQRDFAAAGGVVERRLALNREVAALNSLGRSADALSRLDGADFSAASGKPDPGLRAKVLLPLGRCDEALPSLQSEIEERDLAAQRLLGPAHRTGGYMLTGAETLLAMAYCHIANRRWDVAVAALSRVMDPLDPSLLHYTAAWYTGLRKLGAEPNTRMELAAKELPARGGTHALSLALVRGDLTLAQAQRDLSRQRLGAADGQDAMAELLFFAALAAETPQARVDALERLDALSPFGSSEWVIAKLLFPVR